MSAAKALSTASHGSLTRLAGTLTASRRPVLEEEKTQPNAGPFTLFAKMPAPGQPAARPGGRISFQTGVRPPPPQGQLRQQGSCFSKQVSRSNFGRKSHVANASTMSKAMHECMEDIVKNGQHATKTTLDVRAFMNDLEKNGIDPAKHPSHRDLHHGKFISTGRHPSSFQLGMIIDVPHVVPTLDSNTDSFDEHATISQLGPLTCKRRPAIVVAVYQDRCKVLPLYTHQKNGTENKPPYVKQLAIFLVHEKARTDKPADRTLRCNIMPFGKSDGESCVYPTDSYCVGYSWPLGIQEGRLDETSTYRILEEYQWHQEAGTLPINQQADFILRKRRDAFTRGR